MDSEIKVLSEKMEAVADEFRRLRRLFHIAVLLSIIVLCILLSASVVIFSGGAVVGVAVLLSGLTSLLCGAQIAHILNKENL